jgi:hypothetical protein
MIHGKTSLIFASIVVAGALTGVALAILLQQLLVYRHQDMLVIGTRGSSVEGADGAKGVKGAISLIDSGK